MKDKARGRYEQKIPDLALGAIVSISGATACCFLAGPNGTLRIFAFWCAGIIVLHLWSSNSRAARITAAVILPAILLQYMLPNSFRSAIAALPTANCDE
ncbi:hypothetical protein [Paraherbaspirillum soli]|uniref:Uncharacterized protein n=1 Tax=Paraherbaspirillum soli TaxID=631222 RepID=A0ABW0MCY4_9BURK